jgi:hypothetical protein
VATLGITHWRSLLCCVLISVVQLDASVIVQLKVVEGEGMEYHTGSRATRGLTVLVTDESGKPVENAAVSFLLPDSGATGVFKSGLGTEIVNTGADGRATVLGMRWNNTPGPVEVHITAIKDQARAGIISTVYLSASAEVPIAIEAPTTSEAPRTAQASRTAAASRAAVAPRAGGEGEFKAPHKGFGKWLLILAAAGGAAAVGIALGGSHGSTAAAATSSPVPTTIGAPSITVGHP